MTLHELEIPPGPGASFTSKDGQRPMGNPARRSTVTMAASTRRDHRTAVSTARRERWSRRRWRGTRCPRRRRKVAAVVKGDRELARIATTWRAETIEPAASARSWSLRWRRGMHDCAVFDDSVLVASGTAQKLKIVWRKDREHTTAVWLHRALSLDQRAVLLLALLRRLGPPAAPPT